MHFKSKTGGWTIASAAIVSLTAALTYVSVNAEKQLDNRYEFLK